MAEVEVRVRNEANTSGTTVLADAFNVSFQVQKNGIGVGSFSLPIGQTVAKGSIVQFLLGGEPRFWCRVDRSEPHPVSVADEGIESTDYSGPGGLVDWVESSVKHPAGARIIPVVDERVIDWFGPDYDDSGWGSATEYVAQGWTSPFYEGLPGGWTDPDAMWIGPSTGDTSDAPDGDNYFRQWVAVDAGPHFLDFAGDNRVTAYVNGRQVGQTGFRQKSRFEFETIESGSVLLAFRLENFNDPPPGDNPTALLWTLRTSPGGSVGPVVARSSDSMKMLEYPSSIDEVPLGAVLRILMADNALMGGWSRGGTDTHDSNGVEYPAIGPQAFRLYEDSLWDVLREFIDVHIDIRVDVSGKTMRPYVKGSLGSVADLTLVAGASTVGQADPGLVNLTDLKWDRKRAEFDAIGVRYQRGWAERGSGDRWGSINLGQVRTTADANRIADALLDLYGADQDAATFKLVHLDEDEWPFTAVDVFDTLAVPTEDLDETEEQVVSAITVSGDADGDAEFRIEVGSLVEDRLEWLERAARRGLGAGALGGRGAAAAPALPIRALSVPIGDGQSEWHIGGSNPATVTTSGVWNPPETRFVSGLRLECLDGTTGTTTVEVYRNGVLVTTLSVAAGDERDVDETVSALWVPNNRITLACTSVGHTKWDLYASVSRAG